jgi:hypothetical protein
MPKKPQPTPNPCAGGHRGPFTTDPGTGNRTCRACGMTTMGG